MSYFYTRTLTSGNPFTPNPVTANKQPANLFCESPADAVVTYSVSKLGPPNVTEVENRKQNQIK